MTIRTLAAALAALALSACTDEPQPLAPRAETPQEAFWSALSSHCGNAYEGGIASEDERDADWMGKRMVAHWTECEDERIVIAFHVEDPEEEGGWDRSRTWILTREIYEDGNGPITLKHDHRHSDGEADAVTFYGGTTAPGDTGSAGGQDFPVDEESIALFTREGLDASLTNVWRVEVGAAGTPDAGFAYQLTRENDPTRLFRVEMDATTPVTAPPPAWGW